VADFCDRFVLALLQDLDARMDRRRVQTCLDLLLVIVRHRHRNQGLLLSELGGFLLGAEPALAGTKRISNLLHSPAWTANRVDEDLWQQADQALDHRWPPTDELLPLRSWLLDHGCHPTGKRSRSTAAPLYRLRLALSQLWLAYRPVTLPRLDSG
jgi:hypothetical protein